MKKCWSPDISYRPQAKGIDMMLMEMSDADAEPLSEDQQREMGKKRSGDLLYDIFPRHVADALKAGQKVEPEHHEMVTVIFSGTSKLIIDMSPEFNTMVESNTHPWLFQTSSHSLTSHDKSVLRKVS